MNKKFTATDLFANYNVALDHFPEFSQEVAIFMSCYALVESYIHQLLIKITNISESDAFIISGSFVNVKARIDLLELLIEKRPASQSEVLASRYFIKDIRAITELRNTYAHGTYSITNIGEPNSPSRKKLMIITPFAHSPKKKAPKVIKRDITEIRKDVSRIKFLICQLHHYINLNELPEGA